MRDFVARHHLDFFPQVADTDGSLWQRFGVRGQPAWVFVDRQGNPTLNYGPLSEDELGSRLDALTT